MKYFPLLMVSVLSAIYSGAQPGYQVRPLHFSVYDNDQNVLQGKARDFVLEWRSLEDESAQWAKALPDSLEFVTKPVESNSDIELKIYRKGRIDTMFIRCDISLRYIPFQSGRFNVTGSMAHLANMQAMNGTRIVNQDWSNFREGNIDGIPDLKKHRYFYFLKEHSFFDEDETDVIYEGYSKSEHLKEVKGEGVYDHIFLNRLYHAPALSPSVFSVGYVFFNDAVEGEPNQFFLESDNGCRSWKIKFALPPETMPELLNITEEGYTFGISYPEKKLLHYNKKGMLIDSAIIEEDPCDHASNIFYPCRRDLKQASPANIEISDPMMGHLNIEYLYYTTFNHSGRTIVIDQLPFSPRRLKLIDNNWQDSKPILELNAGDTYAHLAMRKNKLVLVSYYYTMVSLDFGKTWTFYRNGTFNGGEWNFIWLDDDTLVNVTNYYADVMIIR